MPKQCTPKTFVGQKQQRNLSASALGFCRDTLSVNQNYPVLDNSSSGTLIGNAGGSPHFLAIPCNEESAVCNRPSPNHSPMANDEDNDNDYYANTISSEDEEGLEGTVLCKKIKAQAVQGKNYIWWWNVNICVKICGAQYPQIS